MSDDTDSNVLHLPTRGSDSGGMPDAPDGGELFYSEPPDGGSGGVVPPESPVETTMELPSIRGPISPETALRETGIAAASDSGDGEDEEGEYVQPRSLADRLGDWLEHRLEVARDRHASEAPFREAEIARKAALLEARTAQETAMMEQNGKLHTALMKAKADKAAARGKADAARSSSSGLGTDKGGRSKAGGGNSGGGSGRGGTGGGRGSGTNGPGGTGRGSGGGNSPKGTGKGSDRSAGGRGGGSKGNESSGGSKGRQNGSGGSGSGNSGSGKGSPGGSGRNGSGGSGSGKGGRTQNSPASSPWAERARGRQERAAARQAARQQRRSADQAASLADRSKDRDQDRANRQAEREQRRAAKAERKAARKAKREAAKAAEDRTTLGEAVAEEAQRRWDKRRAAEKDKVKDSEATTKKMPKDAPETSSDGTKDGSAPKEPDDGKKSGEKPSDGSGDKDAKDGTGTDDGPKPDDVKDPPGTDDSDDGRSFKEKLKDFFTKAGEETPPEPEQPSRLRPEDFKVTVDRPGGPTKSTKTEAAEEDIPDAVIVDDPSDPFGATVTNTASLPRAPEPHTQRPGTTRPTAQEDPVAPEVSKTASGQAGLAAQHRTDITFDEYLMEIVNIAIAAGLDKERAQDLAVALGKVADALRDMATDLVGDHNIATEVVDQITDLADAATRMKQLAERCAIDCELASEAARVAAMAVGRVYGEDIQAMDDAGLAHASSAAHHD
ncbi:ATP/GTP-binding protein [Streptomyces misionensis]|uniref:ATP/GTP-binding protein n=1 Tax=Streptomyces misionensis TaxID=67331 RepID=UPI0033BB1A4B